MPTRKYRPQSHCHNRHNLMSTCTQGGVTRGCAQRSGSNSDLVVTVVTVVTPRRAGLALSTPEREGVRTTPAGHDEASALLGLPLPQVAGAASRRAAQDDDRAGRDLETPADLRAARSTTTEAARAQIRPDHRLEEPTLTATKHHDSRGGNGAHAPKSHHAFGHQDEAPQNMGSATRMPTLDRAAMALRDLGPTMPQDAPGPPEAPTVDLEPADTTTVKPSAARHHHHEAIT